MRHWDGKPVLIDFGAVRESMGAVVNSQGNPTSSIVIYTWLYAAVDTRAVNTYFWLSQRLVTDADLDGKDGFELDIMRNSIFASHGRRFDISELQNYFNNQPWYRPIYFP